MPHSERTARRNCMPLRRQTQLRLQDQNVPIGPFAPHTSSNCTGISRDDCPCSCCHYSKTKTRKTRVLGEQMRRKTNSRKTQPSRKHVRCAVVAFRAWYRRSPAGWLQHQHGAPRMTSGGQSLCRLFPRTVVTFYISELSSRHKRMTAIVAHREIPIT